MGLRCAVLDDYQQVALAMADWRALADRVDVVCHPDHHATEDAVVDALRDCEIVVAMRERTPLPASVLARLPRLRLIVTTGMRNASIDLAAAAAQGVTVCGTASAGHPPAELTWALILGLARHVAVENAALRAGGPWQSTLGADLHGQRLGVLGLGRIGGAVARVGLAFGMEVTAWSRSLTPERAQALGITAAADKEELLASADVVSIHLPLSAQTRGLIGAPELELMRPTAYLVNTSRAQIVQRDPLVHALRTRSIAGAGLDVFETEPLPRDDELRRLPNVLATPHLGYVSERNYRTYFREAVEDIEAFLAGAPIRVLNGARS